MAYQIKCDGNVLYDVRDDDLVVLEPKCKFEANTVGEASFTILPTHPHYGTLRKLRSVFEISQDGEVIFRGRMTDESRDFDNQLNVDLEGVLAYANDTIIPAFSFPDDFTVPSGENVVEFLLGWFIDTHNAQAADFQRFKLGRVTVTDPNNVIVRSSDSDLTTWECFKTKLFDSDLGGYLVIRYEDDGNYIDYLERFEESNRQTIDFGENLLDIVLESDASETYSAICPTGKDKLDISALPDGDLTDDLVKSGKFIHSKSAVEQFGWVCVPPGESKWDDVTTATNLQAKAMEYLDKTARLFANTITIKAVDLHFTDEQIQSFRVCRNITVNAQRHGVVNAVYPLTKLDIDLANPQNTTITIGDTVRTLTSINEQRNASTINRIDSTKSEIMSGTSDMVDEVVSQKVSSLVDMIYPVGSIYMSVNDTSPSVLFGGTWEAINERFLLGAGSMHGAGSTGGNWTHTHQVTSNVTSAANTGSHVLTKGELPPHTHGIFDGGTNLIGSATAVSSLRGSITSSSSSSYNYVRVASSGASMTRTSHNHNGDTGDGSASGLNGSGHTHRAPALTNNTVTSETNNYAPPYLAVHMWKRTA